MILVTVSQMFGHIDIFDVRGAVESGESGVCQRVPCRGLARADVKQSAGLAVHKMQRHIDRVLYVNKIASKFAVRITRIVTLEKPQFTGHVYFAERLVYQRAHVALMIFVW